MMMLMESVVAVELLVETLRIAKVLISAVLLM
jgi:hypothetical protein